MPKTEILKTSLKKIFASFMACTIFVYSLVTAPLFGVGAVSFDPVTAITSLQDYLYETASKAFDAVGLVPGGSIVGKVGQYILDAGYSIWGSGGLADNVSSIYHDITNTGNAHKINFSSTTGFSGFYSRNGKVHSLSIFDTDNSSLLSNTYFSLIATEDFQLLCRFIPGSGYGPEDVGLTLDLRHINALHEGSFRYYFTSNVPVVPEFTLYSDGEYVKKVYNEFTVVDISFGIVDYSAPKVLDDNPSALLDYLVSVPLTSNYFSCSNVVCSVASTSPGNTVFNWPSGNTTTLSYENLEETYKYYNNYITPYYQQHYSNDNTITYNNVDYYYEIIQSSTTAPPSTTAPGGSGVVIIDPFTLPPEWVQSDVVELETDHYEVPFESMVADPFDYLVSPYTQTSTETVRSATRALSISPPSPQYQVFPNAGSVQEIASDYINFAYKLFDRSGLSWVVGVAVFGLVCGVLIL